MTNPSNHFLACVYAKHLRIHNRANTSCVFGFSQALAFLQPCLLYKKKKYTVSCFKMGLSCIYMDWIKPCSFFMRKKSNSIIKKKWGENDRHMLCLLPSLYFINSAVWFPPKKGVFSSTPAACATKHIPDKMHNKSWCSEAGKVLCKCCLRLQKLLTAHLEYVNSLHLDRSHARHRLHTAN